MTAELSEIIKDNDGVEIRYSGDIRFKIYFYFNVIRVFEMQYYGNFFY